jgi:DNA-binding IclR family transcriptional regulator
MWPMDRYEFSVGPTGRCYRTSRSFAGAKDHAARTGETCHLYAVRDGRRVFVGYARPDRTIAKPS